MLSTYNKEYLIEKELAIKTDDFCKIIEEDPDTNNEEEIENSEKDEEDKIYLNALAPDEI